MATSRNPSIALSEQQRHFIDDLVASGRYQGVSEVVRDSLRLLEDREARRARALAEMDQAIQEALDSGPSTELDMNAVYAEAQRRARERRG